MNRHRYVRWTKFNYVGSFVSLLLVLTFALAGCGGGGGGGSDSAAGGDNVTPPPPFNPPAGITAKIIKVETADCPQPTVYFTVTDDETGLPVTGLTDQNFMVIEDGAQATIVNFTEIVDANGPIVFSIAMDYSYSLTDQDVLNEETAAEFFVTDLFSLTNGFSNYGEVIKFMQESEVTQVFTSDKDSILAAIESEGTDQIIIDRQNRVPGTGLYDALYRAIENMVAFRAANSGLPERSIQIVITDGKDAFSVDYNIDNVIELASENNIQIIAIGFGEGASGEAGQNLFDLAQGTGGLYLGAPTSDDLYGLLTQLLDNLQNQYSITFDSDINPHVVEIEVSKDGFTASDSQNFECF